ncbi:hypothetical protein BDN71DRAFT_1436468 [Pleurotus eryngii]|uniref:Endonuclease/exonuclease/phosphatase domain-containing protein n=1 Tax=Pleurotus eryngii TaxID=5323 RepID=A0A9P5ZKF3_PLEER|nr:hypothetical protein BDN71DRAFT_1436468 [Pleurotus eryngii]
MVDGARNTLEWTDDGDMVQEVLNVIKALKNTLYKIDSIISVDDNIFRSQPNGPAFPQDQDSRQQAPAPPSYASAVKLAPSNQHKPNQQPKPAIPSPALKLNTNNNAAAHNDGLEILSAEWNRSSNIILTFLSHVNPSAVYNYTNLIHSIVDHDLPNVIISHNTKWSKAVCSQVPSMGFNGHYWDSKITQEPQFVANPAEGLPPVALIVFTFEDPDGLKLKELLKTPIFMDGHHMLVSRAWSHSKALQQSKCLDKADASPEGQPINGLPVSQAWEAFAPLAPGHPKVATYVKHNIAGLTATSRPDIAKHPNLLPIEFTYGGSSFLTVNVYNGGNGVKAEAITLLSLIPLNPLVPMVVAGDFNLHHTVWSLLPSVNQQSAEDLLEWASDNLFYLANPRGTCTRRGAKGQRDSIIDLVFVNHAAQDSAVFSSPTVDEGLSFGSDHNTIVYSTSVQVYNEEEPDLDLGKCLDPDKQQEWTTNFTTRF